MAHSPTDYVLAPFSAGVPFALPLSDLGGGTTVGVLACVVLRAMIPGSLNPGLLMGRYMDRQYPGFMAGLTTGDAPVFPFASRRLLQRIHLRFVPVDTRLVCRRAVFPWVTAVVWAGGRRLPWLAPPMSYGSLTHSGWCLLGGPSPILRTPRPGASGSESSFPWPSLRSRGVEGQLFLIHWPFPESERKQLSLLTGKRLHSGNVR